jgi:hypothetical protein
MMEHRQVEQVALFHEFTLEKHITADHLLGSIDRASIVSELMIRMFLIGCCFGQHSSRLETEINGKCKPLQESLPEQAELRFGRTAPDRSWSALERVPHRSMDRDKDRCFAITVWHLPRNGRSPSRGAG